MSKLPFADNYGAYFTARFMDVDLLEESDVTNRQIAKKARLKYYPPRFRFYTCSKGLKRPQPIIMEYGNAKKMVGDSKRIYCYTTHVVAENNFGSPVELNAITYEQYNKKR